MTLIVHQTPSGIGRAIAFVPATDSVHLDSNDAALKLWFVYVKRGDEIVSHLLDISTDYETASQVYNIVLRAIADGARLVYVVKAKVTVVL